MKTRRIFFLAALAILLTAVLTDLLYPFLRARSLSLGYAQVVLRPLWRSVAPPLSTSTRPAVSTVNTSAACSSF
jgi:hypothetical protein